jgi:hypothetical protein
MASAQVYYNPYPRSTACPRSECWNPRAGHYEQVRPGEYQNDLDRSRCRVIARALYDNRYYDNRVYRDSREECWNPRARTFEQVRPGESRTTWTTAVAA